jgi:mRNA interferase MazF
MRYSVVLVPFPFDDLTGTKVRPAICLTNAVGAYRHVVLAFITSVVPAEIEPSDLLIEPSGDGFTATGLRVRSLLRLHRMVTVPAKIIQRKLGVLPPNLQTEVQQGLSKLFALWRMQPRRGVRQERPLRGERFGSAIRRSPLPVRVSWSSTSFAILAGPLLGGASPLSALSPAPSRDGCCSDAPKPHQMWFNSPPISPRSASPQNLLDPPSPPSVSPPP